jgi:mono/diheme cytochrome c family protein
MRRLMPSSRKIVTLFLAAAMALGASACGKEEIQVAKNESPAVRHGAELFHERCSGCHTLRAAAARGSKPVRSKGATGERTNGPNFNVRSEQYNDILLAIRNGGFSGAIMPANIVVGKDAQDVAAFVNKYAGKKKSKANQSRNTAPNNDQ